MSKHILESSESFEKYAQIDCCYFLIKQAQADLDKPLSPMHKMIDITTGYEKHRISEMRKKIIELLEQIIECKKIIESDYSGDEKFMNELINLK